MTFNKILVPMDGSKHSRKALEEALYLARLCGAQIGLLHVVDLNQQISEFEQVSTGGYIPGELKEQGYQFLAEIMEDIPEGTKIKAIVDVGSPKKIVIAVCENGGYDLIAMGSRGLSPIKQIIMGSVSQYVVQNAPCSVLIVR